MEAAEQASTSARGAPDSRELSLTPPGERKSLRLLDASDRSDSGALTTETANMTSSTSLRDSEEVEPSMRSGDDARRNSYDVLAEEKETIDEDEHDAGLQPAPGLPQDRQPPEEFAPSPIQPSSTNARSSVAKPLHSSVESMDLCDVFQSSTGDLTNSPRDLPPVRRPGSNPSSHHDNSSSSGANRLIKRRTSHQSSAGRSAATDDSSGFLDVSWGSNNFDKTLMMSGFDDVLAVKDGHRIGGARVPPHVTRVNSGSGSHPSGSQATHSDLDLSSKISGSYRSAADQKSPVLHHLSRTEEGGDQDGDPNRAGMIPPVFKTVRRISGKNAKEQQVVHVDGGGDGDISRGLGFKKESTKANRKGGFLHRSRRLSNESDRSSRSGNSFTRLRRTSNASNTSEGMTGFQVLRASLQSARQQSANTVGAGNVSPLDRSHPVDRSDPSDLMGDSSGEDPRRAVGGREGLLQGYGGKSARMENLRSLRDIDTGVPDLRVAPRVEEPRPFSMSGITDDGFAGRSGLNVSSRDCDGSVGMGDPMGGDGGENGPSGARRKSDDKELVAEVGGTAYLRATRRVWGMRIMVVLTFIVVSVIVTVLTYTFFRSGETQVLEDNFLEISTMLVAHTAKSMDGKASSARALSKTYTGVLGDPNGATNGNHPPGVMLSSATLACAEEAENANWKTNWPNVTLPGHDEIGSSLLESSQSRATVFAPLLRGKEAGEWEAYAAAHALPSVKDTVSHGIRSSNIFQQVKGHGRGLQGEVAETLSIPAWQVAPVELLNEGIMWDYYSHPSYRSPIDRILSWEEEAREGGMDDMDGMHAEEMGHHHDHRRSLTTHEEMAARAPPVAATELIPCSKTLLPLHLNPPLKAEHIDLEAPSLEGTGYEGHVDHGHDHRWLSTEDAADPFCSAVFYPVYDAIPSSPGSSNISGVVAEMFSWTDVMAGVLYGTVIFHEVRVVIGSTYRLPDDGHEGHRTLEEGGERTTLATYLISHEGTTYIGAGRITEERHEAMMQEYEFSFPRDDAVTYTFEFYPTDELCYDHGVSQKPLYLSIIAACFFFLSVIVFFVYDYFVNYRQRVVVRSAARSARIVHSLYPEFVRDNLFRSESARDKEMQKDVAKAVSAVTGTDSTQQYDEEDPPVIRSSVLTGSAPKRRGLKSKVSDFVDTPATQLKRFLNHPIGSKEYDYGLYTEIEMDPIAEVFERTTVMLADIEGFTAWCSEREPSQVFRLLETVYREFDIEARKLGVFKVETVGDCYVAVTGLPDPREDHAIVIAKYAVRCLLKFNVLTKRLEANLGPGTASLGMRFGLHSGPVTAGVLRGEKSRFQLFGDTINVASRMESTGEKNMIQVSQDTADLLNAAGKGHWLTPREGPVSAKGKGDIHTYWLQPNRRRPSMHGSLRQSSISSDISAHSDGSNSGVPAVSLDRALRQSWACIGIENDSLVAKERLIRWNAAILESYLLKIVDNRNANAPAEDILDRFIPSPQDKALSFSEKLSEKVMFPDVAYRTDYYGVSSDCAISSEAQMELLEYVARIARLYRDVPFHNFDHASHVTMSANKLLNRVCTTFDDNEEDIASVAARTFGISADPLAQFVVVFSSLVHDVDHQGVPNAQLVKEHDPLATQFNNSSVAEKRSITVAWDILMEDRFRELQSLIFVNGDEMQRFKQLLINTVLATDIADKERSAAGKARWQKAFHGTPLSSSLDGSSTSRHSNSSRLDDVSLRSLKATLVFEQIMQASDVAHTMQHWETFKKWNKRLYNELSKGHREGRGASDPRENWYGGEIGFFDFYIIPLAKKLKECGVFGSAASEYLDYAKENRRRWEEEGQEIAKKMVKETDALVAKMNRDKEAEEMQALLATTNRVLSTRN
ncbi:hypothetical protein ACHAXT_008531 [Thalassiosira profunda]